jgi:Holliday junction resolvase RusA-like endonuclease
VQLSFKRACPGWQEFCPLQGPIELNWTAYFKPCKADLPRISKQRGRYAKKPDRDNIDKLILDALKRGGILKDDCIVADGLLRKRYGEQNMLEIELVTLDSMQPDEL